MGFSDSFKKISGSVLGGGSSRDIISSISSLKGVRDALGGSTAQTTFDFHRGKNTSFGDATSAVNRQSQRGLASALVGAHLLSAETSRSAFEKFTEDDDDTPPPPGAAPAQGAGQTAAQRAARQRAIEAAGQRFGFRQTVATTALGVQGEGAQLGTKRLLGE